MVKKLFFGFYIDRTLAKEIRQKCKSTGRTYAGLMTILLKQWLEDEKP